MAGRRTKRVLLLGWDAADWKFLTPLLDAGKMPNLQRLIDGGASSRVATLRPILSPILWTSIATGKNGDKHDILGFVEPRPDGEGLRPVASTSRRAKALWNILSQSRMDSIVVNWFASHPAEHVRGCVVSNRFGDMASGPEPLEPSLAHPVDLLPALEECRVRASTLTPAQMLPFFLSGLPSDDDPRLQALAMQVAKCASIHNAATLLAETEDWDLLAVYYDMIDHCGHGFMPFAPPRLEQVSEENFLIFRHVMESCYCYHDLMLGRWIELVGDETTIILLSDHGFFSGDSRPRAGRGFLSADRPAGVEVNPVAWHHPQGVLVLNGPSVQSDILLHSVSLLDVAPTILALLGLAVPEDMEGQPLLRAFTDPAPPETIVSYEAPHPDDGVWRGVTSDEDNPWAAREALLQLAELGYVSLAGDAAQQTAAAIEGRDSNLAQIHINAQRYEEAMVILRRITQTNPDPELRCREAMCLIALQRTGEAEQIIQTVLETSPDVALGHLLLGQVMLLEGRVDEAHAVLDRVRVAEAEMPLVHLQLGMVYLRQQRWAEAEKIYRKWLTNDPDSPDAHDGLGVALREQGQLSDAIYEHMQAISLKHDRAQTHVNLGTALGLDRQWDWSIRAFQVAAQLAPDEPYPHRCLARLFFGPKEDHNRGMKHARKMLELRRKMRARGRMPAFSTGA